MWLGPIVLAFRGLGFGLLPGATETALVQPAVVAVLRAPAAVELALWHGLNVPVLLSAFTIILGMGIYLRRRAICGGLAALEARVPISGEGAYAGALDGLMRAIRGCCRPVRSPAISRWCSPPSDWRWARH